MNPAVGVVFAALFAALLLASFAGWWAARTQPHRPGITNLNARIRAWWVMVSLGGLTLLLGKPAVILLFAALSWFAFREFGLPCWTFALIPLQYAAAALPWTWPYALLTPLACFALQSSEQRLGLLLCLQGLSAIPALPGLDAMLYCVLIVQASDVLQFLWGHALGRHAVAPRLSPRKTVEGFLGGAASASILGASLHSLVPPNGPLSSGLIALLLACAGFLSGLVFSAIKRRRGLKDWGSAIVGHGGVLDRVDSLCLAAPLFYVLSRLMD